MFQKLKQKIRNKDFKTLLENFISLSALQLIGMVLPLITLPYVLRVIGFEKYGIVVFATSLIAYFQSLTDFSFRVTAVRDVAIFKNSPKKLDLIYSKVMTIKGIFLLLSLLLISIIVFAYPPFFDQKLVYFFSSLMLIGYTIFPEWFFQGIEKMRYITYLNLGIKIFFALCIFIFIRSEEDYWKYPLLQASGLIGAGVVGQYMLTYKYKLKFKLLSVRIIWGTIKNNFPLFINQFVPTLYNNTSVFLLGLMGSKTMVGIYQAILTVVNLAVTAIEILSRVFFPFLNRRSDAFSKYKRLMLTIVILMSMVLLLFHSLIFTYLHISFDNAFVVLLTLVFGLLGYALSNIFGLNYFIIHRQDKLVMNNTLRASILGFLLAFPLIHSFGILGAALNLSLSRWMMGGGLLVKYIKFNDKKNKLL
ncbi:oligosaccharide flippase family protein [Sphingobacterium sp. N143]|nr:oligosaccharide flippase family protein [Sphingobacterium sp. N143]